MSRKYISQRNSNSFIFPNNEISEYDIEIVHDINDNSVSGTVTSFSATTFSSSSLTIAYNITWNKNNADPYINSAGNLNLFSIHMLAEGQDYYKPFRMVHYASTGNTSATTVTQSSSFTVTPSMMGLTGFTAGDYNFEVRFIGKRAISLTCVQLTLTPVTPTPTPTRTLTPTPTLTSSQPPPTPTATPTLTPTVQTPTPTPTVTPTATTPCNEIYISAVIPTCSDFCTNNYLINTPVCADNTFAGLTIGDYIYGLSGQTTYVAYFSSSSDTNTPGFKIAEVDNTGQILSILQCSGGVCVPL